MGSSERVIGTKRRLSRRAKEGRDEGGIIPDGQKRQECGRRSLERKKKNLKFIVRTSSSTLNVGV